MGVHGALRHGFSDEMDLTVNLYGNWVQRDWWRQWHNGVSTNVLPAAVATTIPNEQATGRLREYFVWGIQPRFQARHAILGIRSETDFGLRAHYKEQDRVQLNGPAVPGGERPARERWPRTTSAGWPRIRVSFRTASSSRTRSRRPPG